MTKVIVITFPSESRLVSFHVQQTFGKVSKCVTLGGNASS